MYMYNVRAPYIIHVHVYAMTVFTFCFSSMLYLQYSALATHYRYVSVLVCVVMILVEVGRLYLAYEGNLREKVCMCDHSKSKYLLLKCTYDTCTDGTCTLCVVVAIYMQVENHYMYLPVYIHIVAGVS